MSHVVDAQGQRKGLRLVAPGTIIAFAGPRVPTGWHICNGTNGTPDLTDRFIVGDTAVGTGTAGGTQSVETGLVHTGFALADHSAHTPTQPAAHSAHGVTQPAAHSSHAAVQAGDHGTHASGGAHTHNAHTLSADGSVAVATNKLVGPTTHSTDGAHTHDAHSAHAGFGVNAHSAHAGFAVTAHSAHTGFGVDAHSVHGITQAGNHLLKAFKCVLLMKL